MTWTLRMLLECHGEMLSLLRERTKDRWESVPDEASWERWYRRAERIEEYLTERLARQ